MNTLLLRAAPAPKIVQHGAVAVLLFVILFVVPAYASAAIETVYVTKDNVMSLNEPAKVQACIMYGDIGSWDAYGGHAYRYIAQIDLSGITANPDQITKATFNIDRVSNTWDDNNNYVLQKVSSPWNPSSVTWGNQPGRDPGTITPTSPVYGVFRFTITQIVKNWLNNPASNYGLVIKKTNEDTSLEKNKGLFACSTYSPGGAESRPTITIESCTEDEWTCGGWGACSADGLQTRSCTKSLDCPNVDTPASPETSQSCVPAAPSSPPAPACTEDIWNCTNWSSCSLSGRQTRSCTVTVDCATASTPAPATSQNCTPPSTPPSETCNADTWSCGVWSSCSASGRQTRSCNKTFDCSIAETPAPETSQSCTPPIAPPIEPVPQPTPQPAPAPAQPLPTVPPQTETCTADIWECENWGACSLSGLQGRSCMRTFNCPNAETSPPATDQYCESPSKPQPVALDNPDAAANQDAIIKATVKLVCPLDETKASQGSGTVIDSAGTILTNKHVIDQTPGCWVGFINNYSDEPYFNENQIADIIRVSGNEDIAVLKIRNPKNNSLPFVTIATGSSNNLSLGARVTTYGYPALFGTTLTYTSGDFSGVSGGFLKTSAIIEHGNSGGGAYLKDGTFIGMPTAVIKGELNALGYIVAIDNINAFLNNTTIAYNPSTLNNYSRVRTVLETSSVKKITAFTLAVSQKNIVTPAKNKKTMIEQSSDTVTPAPQAQEQIEQEKSAAASPAAGNGASKPKTSWFKRLIRWIGNLFRK